MMILAAHNYYKQPGGEDQAFASETSLLERNGHCIVRYEAYNSRIAERPTVVAAAGAVWSSKSARSLGDMVRRRNPDVVHFHNTFPLISPAAYYSAQREGVAVLQTLHSTSGWFVRARCCLEMGRCARSIERKSLRPAMAHKCYRGEPSRNSGGCHYADFASAAANVASKGRPLYLC